MSSENIHFNCFILWHRDGQLDRLRLVLFSYVTKDVLSVASSFNPPICWNWKHSVTRTHWRPVIDQMHVAICCIGSFGMCPWLWHWILCGWWAAGHEGLFDCTCSSVGFPAFQRAIRSYWPLHQCAVDLLRFWSVIVPATPSFQLQSLKPSVLISGKILVIKAYC